MKSLWKTILGFTMITVALAGSTVYAAPTPTTAIPPAEALQQYRVMETQLNLLDPRGILQVVSDKEHETLEECWAAIKAGNLASKAEGSGSVFVCWAYPE